MDGKMFQKASNTTDESKQEGEVVGLCEDEERCITLVSKDNQRFELPVENACISNLIKTSLDTGVDFFFFPSHSPAFIPFTLLYYLQIEIARRCLCRM